MVVTAIAERPSEIAGVDKKCRSRFGAVRG